MVNLDQIQVSKMANTANTNMASSLIDKSKCIRHQRTVTTVSDLVESFNPDAAVNGNIEISELQIPAHQREWAWKGVWGLKRQRRLIDSVMYNYPIPGVTLNSKTKDVGGRRLKYRDIEDGRHRIQTFWMFRSGRFAWRGVRYSELCEEDKERFDSYQINVVSLVNATQEQVAESFDRLNSGKPLTDGDRFWNWKHLPLMRTVENLIIGCNELKEVLGGCELGKRTLLGDWAGFACAASTRNLDLLTTSFIRLSDHLSDVNEPRVLEWRDALVNLLREANYRYPVDVREQRSYAKLGRFIAFAMADRLSSTFDEDSWMEKWLHIMGELRLKNEAMRKAFVVAGAQNLNTEKINRVLGQIDGILNGNPVAAEPGDMEPDSFSDDESDV